ncbi:sulfatase [Novosphingobium aquae]|uniref:Sulfatase n=1 Tax=Novosphingobium aquae TaxID=3133435 RepID=A0ABU8SA48_9SPHN
MKFFKSMFIFVAMAAASTPTLAAPGEMTQPAKPNIIFVLTDDQRFDELGILNPKLHTPNLDKLAKGGIYFRNAVVTTALCSPSRASIITGRYMHRHGVVDNNAPIAAGTPLVSTLLRNQGYDTAFVGKWHMGGEGDDPQPGFNHWVSFAGQGNYWPDQIVGESANNAQGNVLNVDGKHVPQAGYITDELTNYALDWLRTGRDAKKPFFLYLSHKALHADFKPATRHKGQYAKTSFPDPETMADTPANYEGKPMWVRNQRNSWHGADFPYHGKLSMEAYRRSYAETLSAVDESVGQLLQYLEKNHLDKNTIVIFTSDNGFMFGEHGLIDKRNAYEESMRVPLLVYAPGFIKGGQVRDETVANIDFAPTFAELAGAKPGPGAFDGQSWLPIATGKAPSDWRKNLLYEYYWEFNYPMTPTTFALRGDRYKLIQYHGIWDLDELYDLQKDPRETRNLIDDPALLETKIAMRQQLYDMLGSNGQHTVPYTRKFNSGAVFRDIGGPPAATFPERWMRKPGDPDLDQHFLPDSPEKLKKLKSLEKY